MNEKQYRAAIDEIAATESFTKADAAFYAKLDKLTADAKEMICSNIDDLRAQGGKNYYISADGNDDNDGLSPATAWKTLNKASCFKLSEGDAVLLRRGDTWYDGITAQSGVIYSAFGTGAKPRLFKAYNGLEHEWLKTDIPNVWVYDMEICDADIGVIVFDDGASYAQKKLSLAEFENDLDFLYACERSSAEEINNKLYLRCDKGNPREVFGQIDISHPQSIFEIPHNAHDITVKNLEMRYGQDMFFGTNYKNIRVSYCVHAWTGGILISKARQVRFGGGGGAWCNCDGIYYDHCWFYQHFDTAVTPQYDGASDPQADFKNYVVTDSIIETTEYSLEYFNTHKAREDNFFENLIFSYNLCRDGGKGFDDKKPHSRYIKSWNHQNPCFGCEFSHNIFDRAESLSLEIISHAPAVRDREKVSYEHLPKLHHNVYIEPYDKAFADINLVIYKFKPASKITLDKLGVDTDSTYIYSE